MMGATGVRDTLQSRQYIFILFHLSTLVHLPSISWTSPARPVSELPRDDHLLVAGLPPCFSTVLLVCVSIAHHVARTIVTN